MMDIRYRCDSISFSNYETMLHSCSGIPGRLNWMTGHNSRLSVQSRGIQGAPGFSLVVTCSRNRDQVRDAPSLTFDLAVMSQTATSRAWDTAHLDL